jgi:serine/threonine protein kinase
MSNTVTVNSKSSNHQSDNLSVTKLISQLDKLKNVKCNSDFVKNLRIEREIASGGFGVVYLATYKKTDKYIIKKISYTDQKSTQMIINEIKNHFIISNKCKNICKLVCFFTEEFDYEDLTINIVQEYCGIELSKKIESKYNTTTDAYRWTEQLLNALDCIHENNLVHFDIKPANLLIDDNNNLKLIDFGLCREGKCKFFGGTVKYLPKVISDINSVDYRNDCYAAGITIKEIWDSLKLKEIPKNIENLINELSGNTYDLIPTIKEAMKKYLGIEYDSVSPSGIPSATQPYIYTFDKFNETLQELINLELIDEDDEVDEKLIIQQLYNDLVRGGVKNFDSKILRTYPYLVK